MTAFERTGWRDQEISQRHRRWGFYAPAVDLDFVLVEFSLGEPVALIEYKHHLARAVAPDHPTYEALRRLADKSPAIPFAIARYWPAYWCFQITPMNDRAAHEFSTGELLTERQYVERLHDLRSRVVQDTVIRNLRNDLPKELSA